MTTPQERDAIIRGIVAKAAADLDLPDGKETTPEELRQLVSIVVDEIDRQLLGDLHARLAKIEAAQRVAEEQRRLRAVSAVEQLRARLAALTAPSAVATTSNGHQPGVPLEELIQ